MANKARPKCLTCDGRWLVPFCLLSLFTCTPEQKSLGPHRWVEGTLTFHINTQANLLSETAIRETFEYWEEKTHFKFIYGGRNEAGLRRDGKNTVSFLVRWPSEVPMGHVGYCRRWYDKAGNIEEADIILNMQLARFTTLRSNTPDSYYVEGVVAHEIGHMIGLDHIDQETSVMKPKSKALESYHQGRLDPATLAAYRALYGS